MEKIVIKKSPVADTRTCDPSVVTEDELRDATLSHMKDVSKGFLFFIEMIEAAEENHDLTKITHFNDFFSCFTGGFKDRSWWEMHQREERHHFNNSEFIQDDINLIDVLEQIIDGVMAGLGRSGFYRPEPLPDALLQKAYENTAKLLVNQVKVVDG